MQHYGNTLHYILIIVSCSVQAIRLLNSILMLGELLSPIEWSDVFHIVIRLSLKLQTQQHAFISQSQLYLSIVSIIAL